MVSFIIRRTLQSSIVMLTIAFVAFGLFRYAGDPINNMVGQNTTLERRSELKEQLGLNEPFLVQYGRFVRNAVQGDFGISYQHRRPVSQLITERLPATLELAFVSITIVLALGIPVGVYTAIRRNSWQSRCLMTLSLIGVSLPTFLIGILLILFFGVIFRLLPTFGRGDVVQLAWWSTGFLTVSGWKSIIMPSITLSLFPLALIVRLVRAEMLEVMRADFVKFAHARGLTERFVHLSVALRNTLVPIVTVAGMQLGLIIAFAIVTESVFQWPGMGLLFMHAISNVDIPVMSACLVLIGFVFALINLVVDILYLVVDPRLRIDRADVANY